MTDLVERVARAIRESVEPEWNDDEWVLFQNEARAAIRVVVEECADMLEKKARTSGMYPAVTLERAVNDIRALLEDGK